MKFYLTVIHTFIHVMHSEILQDFFRKLVASIYEINEEYDVIVLANPMK